MHAVHLALSECASVQVSACFFIIAVSIKLAAFSPDILRIFFVRLYLPIRRHLTFRMFAKLRSIQGTALLPLKPKCSLGALTDLHRLHICGVRFSAVCPVLCRYVVDYNRQYCS
jgi:hypothetical protein